MSKSPFMHFVAVLSASFTVICVSSIILDPIFVKYIWKTDNQKSDVRFFDMFSEIFIYPFVRFFDIFFTTKQCAMLKK